VTQRTGGRWPSSAPVKSASWQGQTALMAGAAIAAFGALVLILPTPLVLPAFAAVAFGVGLAVAAWGWFSGAQQHSNRITCWDVASTCVFIGFAAGVLSEPGQVAQISPLLSAR
jgi:hypothetical protein